MFDCDLENVSRDQSSAAALPTEFLREYPAHSGAHVERKEKRTILAGNEIPVFPRITRLIRPCLKDTGILTRSIQRSSSDEKMLTERDKVSFKTPRILRPNSTDTSRKDFSILTQPKNRLKRDTSFQRILPARLNSEKW